MFGKVVAWLRGDDLGHQQGATMNEDGQVHDNTTAAEVASQAGIVRVDGTPTTPEGQPVDAAASAQAQQEPPAPADPQAEAAAQLAAIYKSLPGVVPALIGGATVAEVQQSFQAAQQQYADIRAQLLAEQG